MSFRITSVSAFLVIGDNDEEGIIGIRSNNELVPFVVADENRLETLRPVAQMIGKRLNKKVTLARFSVREDVEVIHE